MIARQTLHLMAVLLLICDCAESESPPLKIPEKRNLKEIPALKFSSSFPRPVMVNDVTGNRVVPEDNFAFPKYIFSLGKDSKYPKHPLRPGEDTVYPHLQPKKTKFPMPHLYSGDLYAHEDGEAFIAQDDAHLIEEEYDFEKSAAQTDRFIPYTYIIELKETYEDDLSPQSSQSFSTLDPSMQRHIKNLGSTEHKPRLKSEEVLKKVEIFIEKGYDRGAYDHKGFEDHTSAFDKYSEHSEGRYGGSSSSRTREGESYHQHMLLPDDTGTSGNHGLGRSGTSLAPIKFLPSGTENSSRRCSGKRVSKCHPLKKARDRAVVIPILKSRQQKPLVNKKGNRKGFVGAPLYFKKKYTKKKLPISGPNSTKNKISHQTIKPAPSEQSFSPPGFFSHKNNNFFSDSPWFSSPQEPTTSQSETHSLPFSLDKLFAFPVYSSTYDDFHSKHTIPAFPFDGQGRESNNDKMNSNLQLRHRSKRRPVSNSFSWEIPKFTNFINLRSGSILNSHKLLQTPVPDSKKYTNSMKGRKLNAFLREKTPGFDFGSHNAMNIGLAFENNTGNVFDLARSIGQPVELLRREPCISPTPLTANFEFGRFKPKLGPPDWFEGEPHFLDPLKGQVDRLREAVYEPVLKEALCL